MPTLEGLFVSNSYKFFGVMLFRDQCIHSYVFLQASCLKFILLEHKKRARGEIVMFEVSVVSLPKYRAGFLCGSILTCIQEVPF